MIVKKNDVNAESIMIDDMINNEIKINGRRSCSMIPDKIIAANTIQITSRTSEIIHKVEDTAELENILCPAHPPVDKPMRQRSVAKHIIIRIKMSISRSLIGGILIRKIEN